MGNQTEQKNKNSSSKSLVCEACSTPLKPWKLDEVNTLDRCPSCGHIHRDLKRCNANARTHPWGGVVAYDRIRNKLTFNSMKKIVSEGDRTVLDIGFGAALLLKTWVEKGWNAFGIEAETLEIPIDAAVKEKATLTFCKVEEASFEDSFFDLVYAIHVIEHIDNPRAVFEKCYAILKKDGKLYFMTPNAKSLGLVWFKASWWNLEDPTHIRFYSPESVTKMLKDAGFSSVKIRYPVWDSVMMEANSILRMIDARPNKNGILNKSWMRIPIILLAAPFFALRLLVRSLSPSMEIIAHK